MKKISLIVILSFFAFATTVSAQDDPLKGKKGQPILPEASDIGLGVNMIPLLNWFGNSFNNNSNNTYAGVNKFFSNFGTSVIMGKYMLTEKSAVRVNFGFNFTHSVTNEYVADDSQNDPNAMVIDTRVSDVGRYALGLGYEMRRGKGRIQGYYGVDLALLLNQSTGASYTYGNGYTSTNIIPTSTNFGSNISGNQRTVKDAGATAFGIGLRPFVGVEYFVAPKLSIGCEFGYSLMYMNTFGYMETLEYYEASTGNIINVENKTAASSTFSGGVDNFNGAIFMMFYF